MFLHTFESGKLFVAGVVDGKDLGVEGRLCIHDGGGLRGSCNRSHTTALAGQTLHVSATVVYETQAVAGAIHQCRIIHKVEWRPIVAYQPPT